MSLASGEGRYELKYGMTPERALALMEALEPYCEAERGLSGGLGRNLPGGADRYVITSTYFDTTDLAMYWAKRTHEPERMKLRVRAYGPNCESPVSFEIKRRVGDIIIKRRARAPRVGWEKYLLPGAPDLKALGFDTRKAKVYEEFFANYIRLRMRPVVSVRYDRVPFVCRWDDEARVTFDYAIRYAPVNELVLPPSDADYRMVDHAWRFNSSQLPVILELKYDTPAPSWMGDLVRRFDLYRTSFSKYVAVIEELAEFSVGDRLRIREPG